MLLPIVVPIPTTPWDDALKNVAPGSVMVHIQRDGTEWIHFEGGIYSRERGAPVSDRERDRYAIQAAMRAFSNYPTIAKARRPSGVEPGTCIATIGHVDTDTWKVTWLNSP